MAAIDTNLTNSKPETSVIYKIGELRREEDVLLSLYSKMNDQLHRLEVEELELKQRIRQRDMEQTALLLSPGGVSMPNQEKDEDGPTPSTDNEFLNLVPIDSPTVSPSSLTVPDQTPQKSLDLSIPSMGISTEFSQREDDDTAAHINSIPLDLDL